MPSRRPPRRLAPDSLTAALALVALVVAAFLPWAASGRAERDSFELFRVADRLGVVPSGLAARGVQAWPLLPLVAVVGVTALVARRRRVLGLVALGCGAVALAAAVVVLRSPLVPRAGLRLTLGAGTAAVLSGLLCALRARPPARHRTRRRPAARSGAAARPRSRPAVKVRAGR